MKSVTVVDSAGNAYPVGGCLIVNVKDKVDKDFYERHLRVITPLGDREYTLSTISSQWGTDWPIPKDMIALRDRIVEALMDDDVEIVDLRVKDPVEVTGTN